MMRRTYAPAQPTLTSGDDRVQGACVGRSQPFDVLWHHTAGPAYEAARVAAWNLCRDCPIRRQCWRDNHDADWLLTLVGKAKPAPEVHTGYQRAARNRHRVNREERLADLRELIAQGADMAEVCARLQITKSALWKWCDRNGYQAEWRTISPPPPEVISLRTRHRKGRAA